MMNIRSLSNPQTPTKVDTESAKIKATENSVKTHDTTERDADGRQPFHDQRRPVTQEELDEIMEAIKKHDGVKANNFSVELVEEEDQKVLYIKTPEGQTVRRVPESNFHELLSFIDQSNPRLLNKSA